MTRRRECALTLLELVLALSVLALILAVVAGIFHTVVLGSIRVEAASDEDLLLGEVDDLLADDLAFLTILPDVPPVTLNDGDGDSYLAFYTSAGSKSAWGDIATPVHLVTYRVGPLSSGGKGLFRHESPLVETDKAYYDDPVLVIGSVLSFTARATDGLDWFTNWSARGETGLPLLLSLTVEVSRPDGSTKTIFVESAPHVEFIIRPKAERASSGEVSRPDGSTKTIFVESASNVEFIFPNAERATSGAADEDGQAAREPVGGDE